MRFTRANSRTKNAHGFSYVEVLAAVVAASILALTAGIILVYATRNWQNLGSALTLQRDEQIAMDLLMRLTRAGTNLTFTSSPPRYTVQRANHATEAIYSTNNGLYYDPNTNTPNDQVQLINGTLWGPQFSVTFSNNAARNINQATILLVQKANSDIMSNQVTVTRRN